MYIQLTLFLQGAAPPVIPPAYGTQVSKAYGQGAYGGRSLLWGSVGTAPVKLKCFSPNTFHKQRQAKPNNQTHQHDDYRQRMQNPNDAIKR